MLNASSLLGQSAGSLAIRNPWSGAARLTRGAIAHQSNFYKTWFKNSPNNFEHFVSFKTYTFFTIQADNSTGGPRRQTYRSVTTDLSNQSLTTVWAAVNATAYGNAVSTTELLVMKSAGTDAMIVQCVETQDWNFQPVSWYSGDGVAFYPLGRHGRRFNEQNGRCFLFDSMVNGTAFNNIYSAPSTELLAAPSAGSLWVSGTLPVSANWERVVYGNSRWLIFAPKQMLLCYSTDGQRWVEFVNFFNYFNGLNGISARNVYDFRFDGTNFWVILISGGKIQSYRSSTGEFWTSVSEFYLDDHQIMEMSGNMVNGVLPRTSEMSASQDFATPPAYYNGQWFYKVRAQVPGRASTSPSLTGLWETEFLVSTPDFLVWNKHPDHWVAQHSRDVTTPTSSMGWLSDRNNQDYQQSYSCGGVYCLGGTGAPMFKPGPGYASLNTVPMLIADTTNAREVYYAL